MTEIVRCAECSEPIEEDRLNRRGPVPSFCLPCRNRRRWKSSHRSSSRRRAEDPEYAASERRRWAEAQRRRRTEDADRYRRRDAERKRERWASDPEWRERQLVMRLANRYGMTVERYYEMLDEQSNTCAICRQPPSENERLHVDHDHACCAGKKSCGRCVRGLLCAHCNNGIGRFTDEPALLRAAATYLDGRH